MNLSVGVFHVYAGRERFLGRPRGSGVGSWHCRLRDRRRVCVGSVPGSQGQEERAEGALGGLVALWALRTLP